MRILIYHNGEEAGRLETSMEENNMGNSVLKEHKERGNKGQLPATGQVSHPSTPGNAGYFSTTLF